MAGYFTDSRNVDTPSYDVWIRSNASGAISSAAKGLAMRQLKQSTYSFRSGDRVVKDEKELLSSNGVPFRSGFDTGHKFWTQTEEAFYSHNGYVTSNKTGSLTVKALLRPIVPSNELFCKIPDINVNYYGPEAINKTMPTKPVAGVANFLGEAYRDGLPRISALGIILKDPKTFQEFLQFKLKKGFDNVHYPKELASQFIEIEFAWKPFVSDLRKMLLAVLDTQRLLDQLERDSGRLVRRRYSFPVKTFTESKTTAGSFERIPRSTAFNWVSTGSTRVQEDHITERYWFSGAYTYYLANEPGFMGQLRNWQEKADYLLGTDLTIGVLWNLAPWTWLSDWFVNIGSNLENYTQFASDDLVLRYGYLMRETIATRSHTIYGAADKGVSMGPVSLTTVVKRKEREKATPFGFSSNPDSWNARQWAIIGSLGMTLAPGRAM